MHSSCSFPGLPSPPVVPIPPVSRWPLLYRFVFYCATYIGALAISVITYRLSAFHPLYRYPGPLWCRMSMFCHAIRTVWGASHHLFTVLKRQNNEDLPDEAPPPTRHLLNDGILAMGAASETSSGVIISIVSSRTPRRMQRRSTVSTLKARTYLTPRTIMTCITSMWSCTYLSASHPLEVH
ncbi:hypothetical protein LXA43DRAFT_386450 [Ganoderma leucocontextum]|nr:hypothetical protein LXA43DRAFT_386450 [Ganoderma leucocontextum]